MLLAIPTFPSISFHVEMSVTGMKSFRLVLKDETADIQIKLKDQIGQVLYKELVTAPMAYNRVFNVAPLPIGEYTLELEFPHKHQIIPMIILRDQVKLQTANLVEYFKPTVRQKGEHVSISMLNITKDPVNILVYDKSDNQLLFEERIKGEMTVGKQFDFSKAGAGNYLISMNCNNVNYTQIVSIK
jgi:hypothetical protein